MNDYSFIPRTTNEDAIPLMLSLSKVSGAYCFVSPTETGLKKNIIDATWNVRNYLKRNNIHDYSSQNQGLDNKKIIDSFFVTEDGLIETKTSLYRPATKKGDPRIWFSKLGDYAFAGNLLVLFQIKGSLYIANVSNKAIWRSFENKGNLYELLIQADKEQKTVSAELLSLIKGIHDKGWIKSTATGDTAVGDTLEHELGLKRNSSKNPDYKGIELKASRVSRNGTKKNKTRITLFTKVPDSGLSYRGIVEKYGKNQTPHGSTTSRLQLYETFKSSRPNAYGLLLSTLESKGLLNMNHREDSGEDTFVCSWKHDGLVNAIERKHKETFFVKAQSKTVEGVEYFLYEAIEHTKKPNTDVIFDLIDKDIITVDLAAHISEGKYRDHGVLFKIHPDNLELMFGEVEFIDLNQSL